MDGVLAIQDGQNPRVIDGYLKNYLNEGKRVLDVDSGKETAMDDEEGCKCPPPGLPLWMGTFADLMSLLMCFFVLLLSFSEMDVLKFKRIAGSMKFAFGVQNRLEVKDIPKGTSIIAQEFRPGRPEPTPIDVIMQQTIDITQQTLEFQEGESDRAGGTQKDEGKQTGEIARYLDSRQSKR